MRRFNQDNYRNHQYHQNNENYHKTQYNQRLDSSRGHHNNRYQRNRGSYYKEKDYNHYHQQSNQRGFTRLSLSPIRSSPSNSPIRERPKRPRSRSNSYNKPVSRQPNIKERHQYKQFNRPLDEPSNKNNQANKSNTVKRTFT